MTFDPTKPVQTRDGRKARIIGGLEGGPERIAVAITISGMEFAEARYTNGMYLNGEESERDLINIPEKRWVNVYRDGKGDDFAGPELFLNHDDALFFGRESKDNEHLEYVACIPFTEGQGL